MNKLYRLPLRMRSKTQLADPRHRRKSTNPLVAGILAVGALFALAAIGLIVFGAFKHKPDMPKEVGIAPAPAIADVSPAEAKGTESKGKENHAVMPLANPNPTLSSRSTDDQQPLAPAPVASATPSHSSSPATTLTSTGRKHEQPLAPAPVASATPSHSSSPAATLTSTGRKHEQPLAPAPVASATPSHSSSPATTPTPTGRKHEQKAEAETRNPEKPLTKTARQNLEKKRQEAERKRAQLEEKYQNHEISADAYNKGEEEYKSEIQKYRTELKSGT